MNGISHRAEMLVPEPAPKEAILAAHSLACIFHKGWAVRTNDLVIMGPK